MNVAGITIVGEFFSSGERMIFVSAFLTASEIEKNQLWEKTIKKHLCEVDHLMAKSFYGLLAADKFCIWHNLKINYL